MVLCACDEASGGAGWSSQACHLAMRGGGVPIDCKGTTRLSDLTVL